MASCDEIVDAGDMRWWLGLVAVGFTRQVEAQCLHFDNIKSTPGEQLETTPPSDLTISIVRVLRSESWECGDSTSLQVEASATDDTTPSDMIAFRVRFDDYMDDRVPMLEPNGLRLVKVNFVGADVDLDFDLHLAAVDRSGNVGPETVIPIYDEAPGCNAGGGSSTLAMGLALLALRRRRRSH